tara:strand:- start:156 stop:329 length:174 start_codon:yes stop_codon:yes gene_type:complete
MKAANKIEQELDAIQYALKTAKQYGLEAEVIYSAMRHQTISPDIVESLEVALGEWDI